MQPLVVVMAGPNGSGKSTCAATLLPPAMEYVNADEVAKTLPGYPSRGADLLAGRMVLGRMEELEVMRADFAVETTLASRSLAARLIRLRRSGYRFRLVFLWSPDVNFSVSRVASRVRAGGHAIPEETIRRRYEAGLRNFFELYRPLADVWEVFTNLDLRGPRSIAEGNAEGRVVIYEPDSWSSMQAR